MEEGSPAYDAEGLARAAFLRASPDATPEQARRAAISLSAAHPVWLSLP